MASIVSEFSTSLANAWFQVETHAALRIQAEAKAQEALAHDQQQIATIAALRQQLAEEQKKRQKEERRSKMFQDALQAKREVVDSKRKKIERLEKAHERQLTETGEAAYAEEQLKAAKGKRRRPCSKNWCQITRRMQNMKLAELKRKVKHFSTALEKDFGEQLRVTEVTVEPTHCAGATPNPATADQANAPAAAPQQREQSEHIDLNDVVYKVKLAEDLVTKISPRRVLAEARRLQRSTPARLRTPLSAQHLLKIRKLVAGKDARLTSNRGYRLQ